MVALRNLIADLEPFARNPILLSKAKRSKVVVGEEKLQELIEDVKRVIKKHSLPPAVYSQFENYSNLGYTKNLVHSFNGASNLIIMCWAPNQSSLWHAHEGSRCFVRCLRGRVLEQQARLPAETAGGHGQFKAPVTPAQVFRACEMGEGDEQVHFIDDSIGLHKVSNLSCDSGAVTMHFYTPAYTKSRIFKCQTDETRNEEKQTRAGEAKIVKLRNSELVDVLFDNENNNNNIFED